jgi:hypothetical protein
MGHRLLLVKSTLLSLWLVLGNVWVERTRRSLRLVMTPAPVMILFVFVVWIPLDWIPSLDQRTGRDYAWFMWCVSSKCPSNHCHEYFYCMNKKKMMKPKTFQKEKRESQNFILLSVCKPPHFAVASSRKEIRLHERRRGIGSIEP